MFLQASLLLMSLGAIAQGAPRIYGGHDAPNHKYPYQISFQTRRDHFCSGSILNRRWILSAAHCFEGRNVNTYTIVAGTNFLNKTGILYFPKRHIIHEKYENYLYYDIALIELDSDIVFTDSVKSILLPNEDLQDYGKPAAFAGWGSTVWGNFLPSNALQEINLRLLTNEQCAPNKGNITDAHICTLNTSGEGICHGDSGGPLAVDGVQVGIASYVNTIPCAQNYPDVFTRVWPYRYWIDGIME